MNNDILRGFITIKGTEIITNTEVESLTPINIDLDAPVYYDNSLRRFWIVRKEISMVRRLRALRIK